MDDKPLKNPEEIMVDKDKFDAVLRKIANSKPLPLKQVVVTANLRRTRKDESAS